MDDDSDTTDDERAIELSTIAAIYPELIVDAHDPYTASLDVSVTPLEPLRILFRSTAETAPPTLLTPPISPDEEHIEHGRKTQGQQHIQLEVHELSHLPPVSLHISLPEGYPATKAPVIAVTVDPQWLGLSVINGLKNECARLWEDLGKDQVVYTYIDYVQQQAEIAFGLAGNSDVQMAGDLKLALLDYDLKAKREIFEKGTFDCGICLEPKKGLNCHKLLNCGHVFCAPCLREFYTSCITEGDVDNVKCLDPTCKPGERGATDTKGRPLKRRRQDPSLNPSELLQIPLEQELVQRYVRLKRKRRLEADKNTVYCPRQWCQGAARSKKHPIPLDPMSDFEASSDSDEDQDQPGLTKGKKVTDDPEATPMAERLSVCEDCNFAFCFVCGKSWHGELANCSPRRQKELDEEEKASLAYLEKFSTPCPTCNAPAQKSMGCNHMTCFKCHTHFCYLCSAYLMPDNPYAHFNDPKLQCYMRLWVLEAGDGEGVNVQGFHAAQGYHAGEGNIHAIIPEEDEGAEAEAEVLAPNPQHNGPNGPPAGNPPRLNRDEDDSSDDEEPAPDQRRLRNLQIEIINFAGPGGMNVQHFDLPERPRNTEVANAPAQDFPRRRRRRRRGNAHQAEGLQNGRVGPVRLRGAARPNGVEAVEGNNVQDIVQPANGLAPPLRNADLRPPGQQAAAEPHQGAPPAAAVLDAAGQEEQAGPARAMGLERFLQLAQQDMEDEWDSDELEEDLFGDEENHLDDDDHAEPVGRRTAGNRVMGWR